MGRCNCLLPKKFLYCFSLKCGAKSVGIFMFFLMLGITIALIIQISVVKDYQKSQYPWKQVYSFNIVACFDSFFMVLVNLWFLWGIKKDKATVVLAWVVITGLWLIHSTIVIVVLLCLHGSEVYALEWAFSVVFALIGLGFILYTYLVVYAYWLELRRSKEAAVVPATN